MSADLFLGTTAGDLFASGEQAADDGSPVQAWIQAREVAPAQFDGECVPILVHVTTYHTGACTLRMTPQVDGVLYNGVEGVDARVTVSLPQPSTIQPTRTKHTLGISLPVVVDGVELFRTGIRGTWIGCVLETVGAIANRNDGALGEIDFHGMSIEVELEQSSATVVAS